MIGFLDLTCCIWRGARGQARHISPGKRKPGGFGIQGMVGGFITAIGGSYTAIVGLRLCETRMLLEGMGGRR
jgi:predicted house-cleaning NTP pyrophosphatase (Maf/HAM1 superfamily)